MIPTEFDYVAPSTLDEAMALLAERKDDAKILAGGHSLIPAMKLRLAMPSLLIDIRRLTDLAYIRDEGNSLAIGARTTHWEAESSTLLRAKCPLLPETASHIGDVQVRNRGTIGGSLAHADPAADWPAAMLALDAQMVAASQSGQRTIPAESFFVDLLTSALQPDELLREIRIPVPAGRFGQAYGKAPQPASGFALVGVAVHLETGSNGECVAARVGVTGVASKAYRAAAVEQALIGKKLDAASIAAAAQHATDGVDVNGDLHASEAYRRQLASVYARRTMERAWERAR